MRNAKSFMQVEVTDIRAEFARLSDCDESIEICTVYIHLTTALMNNLTDLTDGSFKNTMSRWVCHH